MRYWKFNRGGSSSYLMHHGIDGQRWGVQHGPPYPLDSKVSTGRRLKVKTKKYAEYGGDDRARINNGTTIGAVVGAATGGPLTAALGGAIGMHLSKKHIEQEKAGIRLTKEEKKAQKLAKKNKNNTTEKDDLDENEKINKTITKTREKNMRSAINKELKDRPGFDDGSEIKFESERVVTNDNGTKTTETFFSNDRCWFIVETNYDSNGKMTHRAVSIDD